jgi:hypothetical protein
LPTCAPRAAVLVRDLDIQSLLGLLDHDALGELREFRHVLQRLAQRSGREREGSIDGQSCAHPVVAILIVGRGDVGAPRLAASSPLLVGHNR